MKELYVLARPCGGTISSVSWTVINRSLQGNGHVVVPWRTSASATLYARPTRRFTSTASQSRSDGRSIAHDPLAPPCIRLLHQGTSPVLDGLLLRTGPRTAFKGVAAHDH